MGQISSPIRKQKLKWRMYEEVSEAGYYSTIPSKEKQNRNTTQENRQQLIQLN